MKRGLILLPALLTTGCVNAGISATESAICRELRNSLPTYSTLDTEQTKQEGADFLDVFNAVCS